MIAASPESKAKPNLAAETHGLIGALLTGVDPEVSDKALQQMELRHRTKNILTIVQSLVNQTLRGDVTVDEARQALGDRLVAMGNAVDLLMENEWEPADIGDVIERALTHRVRFRDRVTIAGPRLLIGPGASMSLSLALHELESNAIKYGVLSTGNGTVTVQWKWDSDTQQRLRLEWREDGGPVVVSPTKMGFGTKLISTAIGRRLGGDATLDYRPEGFVWVLDASAAGIAS